MILHDQATIQRYADAGYWGRSTLLDEFWRQVAAHPDRVAIIDPPDRVDLLGTPPQEKTWAETGAAVNALAARFKHLGLRRDDVVILQLPNVWELVVLYFAISAAGGIPSPLPMQWRRRELGYVAELTQARFYVAPPAFKGENFLGFIDDLETSHCIAHRLSLSDIGAWAGVGSHASTAEKAGVGVLDANDVFSLCWTSGTESTPKGCPMTHNNWFFQSRDLMGLLNVKDGDRMLCVAPLVNMTGVGVMLLPWLFNAGTMMLHHPVNMPLFLKQLTTGHVQYTILVPAILNMILKLPNADQLDLSSVRTIVTGSAPPSAFALTEFKRRWGIEITNIWGQNEGTALVAGPLDVPDLAMRVNHMPWWNKADVQWPSKTAGVEIKLVGEDGQLKSGTDEVGELAYRGPNVFPGYFRRPDLNAKAFDKDGFFYSGDMFKVLQYKYLSFFDRAKDIIIRGGFNISAAEIENLALGHAGILDAAAISVPDETMGEKVCLCIVPRDVNAPPTLSDIVQWMKEQGVASYKLPEHLRLVKEIPRNPVGKILKTELRK